MVDFLGIGVQKSASSWLWSILKEHDEIWMPPRKELHYFDRSLKYPSPSFLATDKLIDRLNGNEEHNRLFQTKMSQELGSRVDNQKEEIEWYAKYFLGTYNDQWYNRLFTEGSGKLKGEITPSYSILKQEDIEHIKMLYPQLKILLVFRNPIERAWSQMRFYITRNTLNVHNDSEKIKAFIDSEIQETRGNYSEILKNWTSVFPEEQIFIGFYDEILEDPTSFMVKVCDFLGVNKEKLLKSEMLNKKVNVSIEMEMPEDIYYYLADKYKDEIMKISQNFGIYPKRWLDNI